ncbi:hypothetical protein ACLB2K_029706 [Fragaria x ananassa]
MATSKSYCARPKYRYLPTDHHHQTLGGDSAFELDESDIYNFARSSSQEYRKPAMSSRCASKKSSSALSKGSDSGDLSGGTPASLPVGIPDWSKILRDEYREIRRSDDDDDEDEWSAGSARVPPHEFLARQMARTRIASFSVHEGVGRTLKGRDLSRVRNAIWEKTGFED